MIKFLRKLFGYASSDYEESTPPLSKEEELAQSRIKLILLEREYDALIESCQSKEIEIEVLKNKINELSNDLGLAF